MDQILSRPIAHRGLHKGRSIPENSLRSFEEAIEASLPIEFDIRLSADGKIVVFHDEELQRMTGVAGRVKDWTFADLEELFLYETEEKIPLLTDVFKLVAGRVPLVIEIKSEKFDGRLEGLLVIELQKYEGPCAIQSFHPMSLIWMRLFLQKNLPIGLLISDFQQSNLKNWQKYALQYLGPGPFIWPNYIGLDHSSYDKIQYYLAKLMGRKNVIFWTITDPKVAKSLLKMGHNIIFEGFNPGHI